MKVVLKSEKLDLEVDNVEKLDDVLVFVEKFFELEHKALQAHKELADKKNRQKH
jgi:hypothetical protein